ncbi:MAG: beta-glucosidase [Opitutaceae bacterium]|jgi:beta-glucosidase|nr:beta-glucosidase [Opitutaceae bacterium]
MKRREAIKLLAGAAGATMLPFSARAQSAPAGPARAAAKDAAASAGLSFPPGFVFGAAAAAYQIEGAWDADGKGPSIWDVFTHEPGRVFENHNGDTACDHYHRHSEDIALMRELGVRAYRLSLAWTRIQPDGTGAPNAGGLAFYDRLIDGLLAAGITPWVTLYHWDLPQALQRRGGFLNPDFVEWFGDYAAIAARRLGDRVKHWMTINEPPCIIGLGHQDGAMAPGLKLPFADCLLGAHHLLKAHGRGVQALRAGCRGPVRVSIAQTSREPIPADNAPRTIEAARAAYFACTGKNFWNLSWWADPVVLGRYPEDGLRAFAAELPRITDADMKLISQPLDFLAYNCYSGFPFEVTAAGAPRPAPAGWGIGNPRGTLPWLAVAPRAPYWAARWQTERYKLPLVFSENGFCSTDFVHLDGKVHDPQRIDFMARYLGEISRAVAEGIPVEGYFYWSILDNFEWAEGYKDRFGLVHVDYATQKRTPKDSFHWYRDLIRGKN